MAGDLQVGWTRSLDVPSALRLVSQRLSSMYALVSMLDSTPAVARLPSLVPLLEELGVPHLAPVARLEEWTRGSSSAAGLGDGDGLNFATFDAALAEAWAR